MSRSESARVPGFRWTLPILAGLCILAAAVPGGAWQQAAKLLASDGTSGDVLGAAVAISGTTAVAGAPGDDDRGRDAGAAYVFVRNAGGTWSQQAKLLASDGEFEDTFGISVAVDGDTAVVGAPDEDTGGIDAGAAYVFVRGGGGTWSQQAKLTASDAFILDGFGVSVGVSGDTVVVGADAEDDNGSQSGAAYVFVRDGLGNWSEQAKLLALDGAAGDTFAQSVSVSGDRVLCGAQGDDDDGLASGSAYVFVRSGVSWSQEAKLTAADAAPFDAFGFSVSLSGDSALVGAYFDDDRGPESGSAYVFVRDGLGNWGQQAKLVANNGTASDLFGWSLGIDGDTLLVGARGKNFATGAGYIFERVASTWTQEAILTASDGVSQNNLGFAAGVSGSTAILGAPGVETAAGGPVTGAAYIFEGNQPPTCDAGPDIVRQCDGVPMAATAADPDNDPLTFRWSSRCSGVLYDPAADVLNPLVTFGSHCSVDCVLSLRVEDGRGGSCDDSVRVVVDDDTAPVLSMPADVTVECDQPQDPAATGTADADDNCDGPLPVAWDDTVTPGNCAGNFTIARTWSAADSCGNASAEDQTITVEDTTPPVVEPGVDDLYCLWSPNHKYGCFTTGEFAPGITDNCSEPITWGFFDCPSSQPDNDIGDGNTTGDCLVSADGADFCVRAERAGGDPAGRRYGVEITAADACGNVSLPASIGNIFVPHDQRDGHEECRRAK